MVALKYKDPADGLYKLVPVGLSTSAADAKYVNVTGDSMTHATGDTQLSLDPIAGKSGILQFAQATIRRWTVFRESAASGNLRVARYDSAGTYIENVMMFDATTGLGVVSGNPTAALGIATKQYVDGYTTTIGDGSALSYTVTHNLNTQNCHVTVRQTATPFERVDCVVRFATVNTVTIVLLTAPAAGAYTVTVSR